jgi:hypothetical protein
MTETAVPSPPGRLATIPCPAGPGITLDEATPRLHAGTRLPAGGNVIQEES